jgi:hypothetical protein
MKITASKLIRWSDYRQWWQGSSLRHPADPSTDILRQSTPVIHHHPFKTVMSIFRLLDMGYTPDKWKSGWMGLAGYLLLPSSMRFKCACHSSNR